MHSNDAREAFLWADQPTAASYTPDTTSSWNGNRADPTITRTGTGSYEVTLPGLAATGPELGHVQVTPFSGTPLRAKVLMWGNNGAHQLIRVRCYNTAGALADGSFLLSYNEVAAPIPADQGAGAHVLSSNATQSHIPDPRWTHSNGTFGPANAETVERLGVGRYRVHLPNVEALNSSTVQVTSQGNNSHHATIRGWGIRSPTGTAVTVETWDAAGAPVDSYFALLCLSSWPAVRAGSNTPVGSGCNGPVLTPLSRPILGTNWRLSLSGLPVGSVLGLMLVGFGDPALPIGPAAPGCTLHVTNPVLTVLGLPLPSPTWQLAIPNNPAYLRAGVFTQGGALVPNINPLWVAASNGVRGTVGDF